MILMKVLYFQVYSLNSLNYSLNSRNVFKICQLFLLKEYSSFYVFNILGDADQSREAKKNKENRWEDCEEDHYVMADRSKIPLCSI